MPPPPGAVLALVPCGMAAKDYIVKLYGDYTFFSTRPGGHGPMSRNGVCRSHPLRLSGARGLANPSGCCHPEHDAVNGSTCRVQSAAPGVSCHNRPVSHHASVPVLVRARAPCGRLLPCPLECHSRTGWICSAHKVPQLYIARDMVTQLCCTEPHSGSTLPPSWAAAHNAEQQHDKPALQQRLLLKMSTAARPPSGSVP